MNEYEFGPPAPPYGHPTGPASLRRVVLLRWLVISVQACAILLAETTLGIHLEWLPMLAVLALLAAFNAVTIWRTKHTQGANEAELLLQVCVDIAGLTVLIYVAGGVTNPLISLYLPIIALAATMLPGRFVAVVVALAVAAYSMLTIAYLPFRLDSPHDAVRLHLTGMWLTFAFSAVIISWFVVRMMQAIRDRDARLASARETALRNERVIALGNLAAGAAHELGTPLATMAVLASELRKRGDLQQDVRDDVQMLCDQIGQCKRIITGLSVRAGSSRAEGGQAQALDAWLRSAIDRWSSVRPAVTPAIRLGGPQPAPWIMADGTLEQALANLFNNAADASPAAVDIDGQWDAQSLLLQVSDRGKGIPPELAGRLGREPVKTRDDGAGIGVMLAYAAIERCGGRIAFSPRQGGGTVASVHLPLKDIRID